MPEDFNFAEVFVAEIHFTEAIAEASMGVFFLASVGENDFLLFLMYFF